MREPRVVVALLAAGVAVCVAAGAPAAAGAAGTTERVSLGAGGAQLFDDSWGPSVSADGRWVAFVSTAANAVPGDTNVRSDAFLRDRVTGETRRISARADGTQGNEDSDSVPFGSVAFAPVFAETSISDDGRYVAFTSFATNLATAGATNVWSDVFLYDRVANTLRRLSTSVGGDDGRGDSFDAHVAPDGTHVVFASVAADLVTTNNVPRDVFLADVATGALTRVGEAPGGRRATAGSDTGDVSAGGRFVAFSSHASNLVGGDGNGREDVFVRETATGGIERVSVSASSSDANGGSERPSISADGCLVAFVSDATNLVSPPTAAGDRVFVRNRCAGTTELASVSAAGAPGDTEGYLPPAISGDGCAVAFVGPALVGGLALRDRCAGATTRADLATGGAGGNAVPGRYAFSGGTGRHLAFDSRASNLVVGDTNGDVDVFVRDREGSPPPGGGGGGREGGGGGDPAPAPSPGGGSGAGGAGTGGGAGSAPGGSRPGAARPLALRLSGVGLSRTRFAVLPRGSRVTRGRGARLMLTASEPATLSLRYARVVAGRRVGRRCVAGAGRGRRCTSMRAAGGASAVLRAGRNTIALTGRIGRARLAPATYRLTLVARTRDGRTSETVARTLTITRAAAGRPPR
ncbi:TolB family protein [Conexibacter woesei]|uniref:WD40 domain protein beta Propeller n=1 Tax=Conexibacter woesei (strain DSM 14684 / CCUG 47730 / CIP 108061 / JCM 11494 / NBRC 100937 / ID131577) TaxID=469383 RepID=D3F324_CONWI|nr:PD40 domain-containing protein [Conexibacter woesei]ADB50304.1 hypothetical protein Cwoe_1878 [Conexibacter woesei DSM 14684]